jgi:hypothetical protein
LTVAKLLEEKSLVGDLTGKTWKIKIIEGDRQGSSAYYPKEVLEEGAHLFKEKTRIFLNHPSANEKWDQPERKVQDIIGWLSSDAVYENGDLYANATFKESARADIKELAEAGVIAMSIRAQGEMTEGKNGMELAKFTAVHSVDVVTVGGAGGEFDKLVEAGKLDPSTELEEQKEEQKLELPKEFLDALDNLTKGVNTLNESLAEEKQARADKALAEAKALEEAGKPEEKQGPSASEIAEALVEAKLSTKARARVLEAVEAGKPLDEAIKAEKEIAEEILAEAGASGGAGHIEDEGNLTESARLENAFSGIYG